MRTAKGRDKYITIVTDLDEAVSVSTTAGDFLMLDDPTTLLRDDVSNLKSFSMNVAGGFEELSNKAIAINKDLLKAYGGFLEPLNDGRGVTFFDDAGDVYVQCDGLVRNTEVVLLNEAKMHFYEEDVRERRNVTAMKVNHIKAYPHLFTSDPEDIIEQLKGLKIVLIASGSSFTKKAEEDCEKAGIHRIRQDGSGFSCTLASVFLVRLSQCQFYNHDPLVNRPCVYSTCLFSANKVNVFKCYESASYWLGVQECCSLPSLASATCIYTT